MLVAKTVFRRELLTNLQKQTFLKNLEEVKARFPEARFEFYSDFKSIKVSVSTGKEISAARNAELLREFNSAYQKTNKEFAAKVKELEISVPSAGEPERWFRAGFGRSVDEAALAARRARSVEGEARALDFTSAEVKEVMTQRLAEVEKTRQALVDSPSMAKLVDRDAQGIRIPKEDVFDLARKFDAPDKLLAAVTKRYPKSGFSAEDANQLHDYAKGIDEFSPTILIAKRQTVNLDHAYQGGASADFLGMGSSNLKATASGIASRSTLEDALSGARKGEQSVTEIFKERMTQFKKVVGGDVVCSGDDCIRTASRALSDRDKLGMLDRLANNPQTKSVRMSFVGPGVEKDARMQLATHGESIEKALRKELEGHIEFENLQNMTFGFDMKTVELGHGKVDLIIGRKLRQNFSASEKREFQGAFERALNAVNKDALRYSQGEATSTTRAFQFYPGAGLPGALVPQIPDN